MPKRSITDQEIGLIKAMLARHMKNREIQFYFNRQDRPVNSGRITQIRDGSYGPKAQQASDAELDAFLTTFTPASVGAVVNGGAPRRDPTLAERARALFKKQANGIWHLVGGETDQCECKVMFDPSKLTSVVRTIAALANNKGGFLFYGITNSGCEVQGLRDEGFAKTDIVKITEKVKAHLVPTPTFTKDMLAFDGLNVGLLYVEKYPDPPIVVCRDGDGLNDGDVLFRYPGQSARIKYGDMLAMLKARDQRAQERLAAAAGRIAEGKAATLDLDTGVIEGKTGNLIIDEELLPKVQFIREGEFDETHGAPTLRLIGDVTVVGAGQTKTVHKNVTDELVLLDFLKQEPVAEPMQYVLHSAHTGRAWLPLFSYARATKRPLTEVADTLAAEPATQPTRRDAALKRLRATMGGAFQKATGRSKAALAEILKGNIALPTIQTDVAPMVLAIQALPELAVVDFSKLRQLLLAAYELTKGSTPQLKAFPKLYLPRRLPT